MDLTAKEIYRMAVLQGAGVPTSCTVRADLQSLYNTEATKKAKSRNLTPTSNNNNHNNN